MQAKEKRDKSQSKGNLWVNVASHIRTYSQHYPICYIVQSVLLVPCAQSSLYHWGTNTVALPVQPCN